MFRTAFIAWILIAVALGVGPVIGDDEQSPPKPGPKDRCAVCGMYVAKYPNWVAVIEIDDGPLLYFDGPKDMFKFLLDIEKYERQRHEVEEIWVTDYYSTRLARVRDVVFVTGSDVSGPMGPELVPVAGAAAVQAFTADHGGAAVLRFDEVGPDHIPH